MQTMRPPEATAAPAVASAAAEAPFDENETSDQKQQPPELFTTIMDYSGPALFQKKYDVMTFAGMEVLADYYREKYQIEIHPLMNPAINTNPDFAVLKKAIQDFQTIFAAKPIGLILWDDVHTLPIILAEKDGKKYIILLDTGSYSASQSAVTEGYTKKLLDAFPDFCICVPFTKKSRQKDRSSCHIDAFVVLKDALREANLIALIEAREKESLLISQKKLLRFRMLPQLLKTAQVSDYLKESEIKGNETAHLHNVKDKSGKKTGQTVAVELDVFRQKHSLKLYSYDGSDYYPKAQLFSMMKDHKGVVVVDADPKLKAKLFNRYSKNKMERYQAIILDHAAKMRMEAKQMAGNLTAPNKPTTG